MSDDVKIAVKDGFDFIELDGMQGSTGAGSAEVIDYVGVPTLPAIIEAIDALEEIGRRQDIEIVLMGGIRDGVDAVKALCLGADAVAFGTSTIIAGGCIACMQCHIGQCVTGIATQDPEHEKRYDPEAESHNIHRFLEGFARPEMPETVVVVGGGDVAMDACRVAKRLPGCRHVKVIYRRGPGEIPARKIELHHAIKEGDQGGRSRRTIKEDDQGGRSRRAIKEDVEFLYHTQQVGVIPRGNQLALKCVKTALGEPDDDGRRRPVAIEGSEHEILCGSVIAAVGQRGICEELHRADMMGPDRVRTEWDSMRTSDPKVFAAGDGAFGGSTIVMAMQHGQRAAYYVRHFLEGNRDPLPWRTPYRTRRVPVAQDLMWERFPIQDPVSCGLGERPAEFPEIELTYDTNSARAEAARCYRCDAETGSADYSVQHREDIFSMARTDPRDAPKLKAMLDRRLRLRENPFPQERPACLDDLVFLPANLC